MSTSPNKNLRSVIAVLCIKRFGKTSKIMHDKRRARDRNRGQINKKAVGEY